MHLDEARDDIIGAELSRTVKSGLTGVVLPVHITASGGGRPLTLGICATIGIT